MISERFHSVHKQLTPVFPSFLNVVTVPTELQTETDLQLKTRTEKSYKKTLNDLKETDLNNNRM